MRQHADFEMSQKAKLLLYASFKSFRCIRFVVKQFFFYCEQQEGANLDYVSFLGPMASGLDQTGIGNSRPCIPQNKTIMRPLRRILRNFSLTEPMHNYTMGPTLLDHNWVSIKASYRGDAVTTYGLPTDRQADGRTADRLVSHKLDWFLTSRAKIAIVWEGECMLQTKRELRNFAKRSVCTSIKVLDNYKFLKNRSCNIDKKQKCILLFNYITAIFQFIVCFSSTWGMTSHIPITYIHVTNI